jgi:ribonuclease HII
MKKSNHLVCGLDEAGRGALAGPIVIAAVVMSVEFEFQDIADDVIIRDSKKLSILQRGLAYKLIKSHSLQIAFEVISAREINKKGINWANIEGFRRHILNIEADQYIVDGRWHLPDLGAKTPLASCMIHADETIPAVLAAGIAAKIKRDQIMLKLHTDFPMYGWQTNTGHGTKQHITAIRKYGICKHHRLQFVTTALKSVHL